jgi:hypothetical protein
VALLDDYTFLIDDIEITYGEHPAAAMNLLPRIVYQMCVHGALIVGSQAKRMAGDELESEPNDWDLLVPYECWQVIALLIPGGAVTNKFGGWRFMTSDGEEVDVWPGSLQQYLSECRTKHGGCVRAVDFIQNRVYSAQQVELK